MKTKKTISKTIKLLTYNDVENIDISEVELYRLSYDNPWEFIEHKLKYEKNPIMYWMELEINQLQDEDNIFRRRLQKYQEENKINIFHCKSDSSLFNWIEIITHPFSKNWFIKNKKHFRNLLTIIYMSWWKISHNTGLHIHISRKGIKNSTKSKLFHFINDSWNRSLIESISWRNTSMNSFEYYSWITLLSPEWLEIYESRSWKYEAVNWKHDNSIEIRIFKSTTKTTFLFARLQFIFLAIEFIKKTPILDCNSNNFKKYIQKQTKYKDILEYFRDDES